MNYQFFGGYDETSLFQFSMDAKQTTPYVVVYNTQP